MTKPCHRVAQLTDLHLAADLSRRVHGLDTDRTARAVLDRVRAWDPDLVVLTGDLADDAEPDAYERLMGHVADLACPMIPMPGNHDCAKTLARVAAAHGHAMPTSLALGQWRLHFLDSAVPGRPDGRVGKDRLRSLRSALDDAPTLVFIHHHPAPIASPWIDAMGLQDGSELLAALDGRTAPTLVAAGHVHQVAVGWHGRVRWLTAPSTCSQARPFADRFEDDELTPGFRGFELRDDGGWETTVSRL